MIDLTPYLTTDNKGPAFTKEYYNLSLNDKYIIINQLEQENRLGGYRNYILYDRAVKSILQHTPEALKKEYPIKGERKTRPEARQADRREESKWIHQALLMGWNKIERALIKMGLLRGV